MLKTIISLLSLGLFVVSTHAQDSKTVFQKEPLSRNGKVVVDNYKGSITVTAWDRDEVEIDAHVVADRDEELVQDTEIIIRRSGNTVRIETDYEKAQRRQRRFRLFGLNNYSLPFVHYKIKMPRTADLEIDDYKSEIKVNDLQADLEVETYKGVVDINDLDGSIRLDTYKGEVRVDFAGLTDDSSFDTYKGEINIRLPNGEGFDLDADMGRKGHLDSDFRLANFRRDDEYYRGSVNGGGPRLHMETYKGYFSIRSR